ncbi:LysR family transcriptional regulator [uncultured Roseibium sp.]|uniref:LysR family transcriptional regulator n=1 Tax=uncultured Roseibium sp. TaxID=1936171 RepID=UPI0026377ADB|nr:LysR family transcriptional regulator [uncultured Roseibium sp.]
MLDDISLFIHITQCRSLAAAASKLDLPAATVTRRLRRLEETLGARLIHRSARKFSLTSEGEAYYASLADLMVQAEATLQNLKTDLHQIRGPLRVAAPTNASIGVLSPMWSGFLKAYPEIRLTLSLSNDNKDLQDNRFDLALRFGAQTDVSLYQKRIGSVATMMVASPEYVAHKGAPQSLEDLHQHKLIWVSSLPSWHLRNRHSGAEETIYLSADIAVDDITLARQIVSDGHGIALLPVTEAAADLEAGKLEPVLPAWTGQVRNAYLVWPTGRLLSARAISLCDFIEDFMAARKILQGGLPL